MSQPSAEVQFNVAAQSAVAQMQLFTNMFKKQIQEMRAEVKKFNEAKDTKTPFSQWAEDAGKFALAMVGANGILATTQKAFQLIAAEIQNAVEVAQYASQRQVPYQQQLKGISAMLDNPDDLAKIDSLIKGSNVPNKATLAMMIKESLSAGASLEDMEKASLTARVAEQRADFMDSEPFTLKQYAIQAVVAYEQFKKQAPNMSVNDFTDAQLRLMEQGRKLSFVDDPKLYAENVGSTINKLGMWGLNQGQSAALTIATTNAVMDQTGEVTATGLQNLIPKIKQYLTAQGIQAPEEWDSLRKWMRGDSEGAASLREYMGGAMLSDLTPEEIAGLTDAQRGKLAVDHIPGRGKAVYQMMQLFAREGEADDPTSLNARIKLVEDKLGFVKNADGSVNAEASYQKFDKEHDEWKKSVDENPLFRTSNVDYAARSTTETMSISGDAIRGLTTTVGDMLKQGGQSSIQRKAEWLEDALMGYSDVDQIKVYRKRLNSEIVRRITGKYKGDLTKEFADNQIDDQELASLNQRYGTTRQQADDAVSMKLMLDRLTDILNVLQNQGNQPQKVEVVNQPPAQPKKPAAEGLKQ